MKIKEVEPVSLVSKQEYDSDWNSRYRLEQLEPDEEYKARLIVNENPDSYAADYLVAVNEIIRPPEEKLFSWIGLRVIEISLSPVDMDHNVVDATYKTLVHEDGSIYQKVYVFLSNIDVETGYFTSAIDSLDEEWSEMSGAPVKGPLVPVIV